MERTMNNMTDSEIRLRCLELALEHGLSTDKVGVAQEFERFVFAMPSPQQAPKRRSR